METNNSKNHLGVLSLAMMSIAGIFTLRTLPLMATYGFSAVFYYLLIALVFFIPSALICAELATGWPKTGGLYVWVREAFGRRFGFLSIWFEWTNTIISFPVTLIFIIATIAYALDPRLAANKIDMFVIMIALFWGATLINFFGIKFSSLVSNIGLLIGTILPCLLIIALGFGWYFAGNPSQMHFSTHAFFPTIGLTKSSLIVGLILGFSGMQLAGFHAQETVNPQRDYPRAIFLALLVILILSILGTLAISLVMPAQKINVVTGIMQASTVFFSKFHMQWFMPIFSILIGIGTLAMLNMWIIGPCKGLLATARYGDLPKVMQRVNKHGAPTVLLVIQACVGSLVALVYLFMPTVAGSYWILIAMTISLTLLMNILIFSSVIVLRFTQPQVKRAYKIPGGKIGVIIVGGVGIIVCMLGFLLSFFPPAQIKIGNIFFYEGFLIIGVLVIAIAPFIIMYFRKRSALEVRAISEES